MKTVRITLAVLLALACAGALLAADPLVPPATGTPGAANPAPANPAPANPTPGDPIAAMQANAGYKDSLMKATVTLKGADYNEKADVRLFYLDTKNGNEVSVLRVDKVDAADRQFVVGSAVMSAYSGNEDEGKLWYYGPDAKHHKHLYSLKGKQLKDRFLRSVMTFEDLHNWRPQDYKYDMYEGHPGGPLVVKATPKHPSEYTHVDVTLDPAHYFVTKMEYHKGDAIVKTRTESGQKQINGKYWKPTQITITLGAESDQVDVTDWQVDTGHLPTGLGDPKRLATLK